MEPARQISDKGAITHVVARVLISIFFMDCCLADYQNWRFYQTPLMKSRVASYPHRYKDPGMSHCCIHSASAMTPTAENRAARHCSVHHRCVCAVGFPYLDLFLILPCAMLVIFGIGTRVAASVLVLDMLWDSAGIIYTGL